jgi:crossover junction endodeoxyribonuclease RusA
MTRFFVSGTPVPKQSFRYAKGGGYTDPRVVEWEYKVSNVAMGAFNDPLTGKVKMSVDFILPDNRRRDLDNLNKGICDALNGIAFNDDSQVTTLILSKVIDRANPGVWIEIEEV